MSNKKRRETIDVMIHCPGSHGVVPDQIHRQATALHELGIRVLLLCAPGFIRTRNAAYPVLACMAEGATGNTTNLTSRKFSKAFQTIQNQFRFAWQVFQKRPTVVLSGSHVDAQAGLWIWPHLFLALFRKVIYALNLHLPVRDHQLGPQWWQNFSSQIAYKPYRIAVAHKRFPPPSPIPKFIRTVEVPLGPEPVLHSKESVRQIRKNWQVPRGCKVFLAFGSVRNHKNIDLAIRALLDNPKAHLVILGTVSSHRDRPLKYYQMLADDLGVSKRVFISDEFVSEEKRVAYFSAADFILMTYSSSYRSQSGTLITAAEARRFVLGASGSSPMRDLVEHFGLGVYVPPDSSDAVADGMATLIHSDLPEPAWDDFLEYSTWETNVSRLLEAAGDYVQGTESHTRQFEGLEEESMPVPKLLCAQDLLPTASRRKATSGTSSKSATTVKKSRITRTKKKNVESSAESKPARRPYTRRKNAASTKEPSSHEENAAPKKRRPYTRRKKTVDNTSASPKESSATPKKRSYTRRKKTALDTSVLETVAA